MSTPRFPWIRSALILLTIATAFSAASAQELRYSFVEGGWLKEDSDIADENGWFAGGSFGLRRFHFFGEYRDAGPFEAWETGGGWHGLGGDRFNIVLEAAYVDTEIGEGYRLSGGIRWLLLEDLEVNSFYNHVDADDFENDGVSVGGLWEFARRFAVGGEWEFGDEADTGRIFGRFYFKED